jgi:hypothetical protein
LAGTEWVPEGVDTTSPVNARVYDCLLGGTHNFPVDRELAARAVQIMPDAPRGVLANRAFLRRVVRYLVAEAGVRQFLDIGSGLPTRGNVHQVVHECDPTIPVVYVDNDPMVIAHSVPMLADNDNADMVMADLGRPAEILAAPQVGELIDFRRAVGITIFSTVHHMNDHEDPERCVRTLRDAVCDGSYLALSHLHNPGEEHPADADVAVTSEKLYMETMGTGRWRSRTEILSYFGDWELIDPGLVPLTDWRPDPGTSRRPLLTHRLFLGGVARKGAARAKDRPARA